MPITIKEVAKHLNLSHTTVSQILNGRASSTFPEATRQRVIEAATALGYQPNQLARALATGRTDMVALWIAELHAYHAEIARHLQPYFVQNGYEMLISDISRHEDANSFRLQNALLPVDGIIAIDWPDRVGKYLQTSDKRPTPLVSIGTQQLKTVDFVVVDLAQGTTEAVRHLLNSSCERIGYLVWEKANLAGDARRDAYEVAIREAGRQPEYFHISQATREATRQELPALLNRHALPDALFSYNDAMAIGAFRVLREMGIHVPTDILLCGCDGLPDCEYLAVPLTTIVQPIETMCGQAWEFLQQRIANPELPLQQLVLEPYLVVRESSQR